MIIDNGKISVIAPLSQPIVDPAMGMPTKVFADFIFNMSLSASKTDSNSSNLVALDSVITSLSETVENSVAALSEESSVRAEETGALAERVTVVEATFETLAGIEDGTQALAAIGVEQIARASADGALAADILELDSRVTDTETGLTAAQALISQEQSTRADEDEAIALSVSTLSSQVNHPTSGLPAAQSSISTINTAIASIDTALASAIEDAAQALSDASVAQETADSKIVTFYQDTKPQKWLLPSLFELVRMIGNKSIIGGFVDNIKYWSSSQKSIDKAYSICSLSASPFFSYFEDDKNELLSIRPIKYVKGDGLIIGDTYNGGIVFYVGEIDGGYNAIITSFTDIEQEIWSNCYNNVLTNIVIGSSDLNTTAIITQDNHTTSAAKKCAEIEPSTASPGDLWFDTNDGNKIYRYDGIEWVASSDTRIATAISAAASAQSTADSKIVTFVQDTAPTTASPGDLWFDSDDSYKLYRLDGVSWTNVSDSRISSLATTVSSLSSTVGSHSTTISEFSASINGIEGRWGVVINADGHMTGIQLIGGAESSSLVIDADVLVNGSLTTTKIKDNAVTVAGSSTGSGNQSFWLTTTGGTVMMLSVANASSTSLSVQYGYLGVWCDNVQKATNSSAGLGYVAGTARSIPLVSSASFSIDAGEHIFEARKSGDATINNVSLFVIEFKK